uniref:Uncharacterized protein n=1 Tax=Gasterosteus aculeatus aculeatus TaxID=481459 RepID=A0AAQ4RUN5_GASAC
MGVFNGERIINLGLQMCLGKGVISLSRTFDQRSMVWYPQLHLSSYLNLISTNPKASSSAPKHSTNHTKTSPSKPLLGTSRQAHHKTTFFHPSPIHAAPSPRLNVLNLEEEGRLWLGSAGTRQINSK